MNVRVKICGITRQSDLEASINNGADAVGFILGFTNSPRCISVETAKKLIRKVPPFITTVIVTKFNDIESLGRLCDELNPDAIQLYGCNNLSEAKDSLPGISLILPINPEKFDEVKTIDYVDAVLLDSGTSTVLGGSGKPHDWDLSHMISKRLNVPVILAGGLNPENVIEAIRKVRPYAVDVSSGVEKIPGIKDPEKIRLFVKRAKSAILDE